MEVTEGEMKLSFCKLNVTFLQCLVYFFCSMYRYCPHWPEDGIGSPENGVKIVLSHQCGCWVLNLGPQKEQPVLLTAKPSPTP